MYQAQEGVTFSQITCHVGGEKPFWELYASCEVLQTGHWWHVFLFLFFPLSLCTLTLGSADLYTADSNLYVV